MPSDVLRKHNFKYIIFFCVPLNFLVVVGYYVGILACLLIMSFGVLMYDDLVVMPQHKVFAVRL